MKNSILLLGAGFSKNWGGWLADEVFDYLFGLPEIGRDPTLRGIMLGCRSQGGFEAAVEKVQEGYRPEDPESGRRLDALQNAVKKMFSDMNEAFFQCAEFEFTRDRNRTIRNFLSRFDAIFSLNQDLLLEHHYVDQYNVALESPSKWSGVQLPGMKPIWSNEPLFHGRWARAQWEPMSDAQYKVEQGLQPIFKPHGSSNWMSSKGKPLLVIGGHKEQTIEAHKILNRYRAEFQTRLCQPNTQLMVIGYGFRDHHINRAIVKAVLNHGLEFSVICPEGREIAKTLDVKTHPDIPLLLNGYDLNYVFEQGVRIMSRRLLEKTFGGDLAEYKKVMQFFE